MHVGDYFQDVKALESRGYISDVTRRKSMAGLGVLKSMKVVENEIQGILLS